MEEEFFLEMPELVLWEVNLSELEFGEFNCLEFMEDGSIRKLLFEGFLVSYKVALWAKLEA